MSKQIIVRRPPKGKRWIFVGTTEATASSPPPEPGSAGTILWTVPLITQAS
jgi:hypothetical protein